MWLISITFLRGCLTCTRMETMRSSRTTPVDTQITVPWVFVIWWKTPLFFFSGWWIWREWQRETKYEGHLESNSVVYLLLPSSGQCISLAARNNSVINSHSGQLRCLRAPKQTTGFEGILAGKPLKMMNSLFSSQEENWRDTLYCPAFTNNYYSVASGWKIT